MATTFVLALGLLAASTSAHAEDAKPNVVFAGPEEAAPGHVKPLTDHHRLAKPVEEKAVRLEQAKVILADYPLIIHDFGSAIASHYGKPIAEVSHDEIDSWLLDGAAYMSEGQARQSELNTPIPHTEKTVKAFRPRTYGRALVFEPTPGVMFDVKGAGAKTPRAGDHSNGLATLGETIREYAVEKVVHAAFQHAGNGHKTVGTYAVVSAGFDVKAPDGRTDPAGLAIRQPHRRVADPRSMFGDAKTTEIEEELRHYGITSAGAHRGASHDRLNVQGTKDGAMIDFGGILVMEGFEKPAYAFDRGPHHPQGKALLSPKGSFPQPHADVRLPNHIWGYTVSGKDDPVADNPHIWSHELATSLRDGRATRADAEQHMRNLMGPVMERFAAHPGAKPAPPVMVRSGNTQRASKLDRPTLPRATIASAPVRMKVR